MGINQLDVELEQLRLKRLENQSNRNFVTNMLARHGATDEMKRLCLADLSELEDKGKKIAQAIEENQSRYRRPSGIITGLFSRVLGPLPHGLKNTKIDDRAEEVMASLPSYRLVAFGLLLGVVTSLITLGSMFPWLMISPFTLTMDAVSVGSAREPGQPNTLVTIFMIVVIVFVTVAFLRSRRSREKTKRFIYEAAHEEEKWFRSGAENWTPGRRVVSCLSFGFCHVINIIYPLLTLVALSLVGAAFMAAYLGEYRRSNDVYRATLAATKLHARYNIYAAWFAYGSLVLLTVITLLQFEVFSPR